MHKIPCVLAASLGLAALALAQNCTTPPAQQTFSNRDLFGSTNYSNLATFLFDLNAQRNIAISSMRTWMNDQGLQTPNQVGATAQVDVYTCPTTRLGNETNAPTNPGSPWTLLGSGTLTIAANPTESPVVFNPPLNLAAGQYGVAVNFLQPTGGPNPGPLHCLSIYPNPSATVTDQFLTFSNEGIQSLPWMGVGAGAFNLRIVYTPDAASAHYVAAGDGCYFRPYAFYEDFPNSTAVPDLANTSQQWIFLGTNYLVVPGAVTYVPPTSPSLSLGQYAASSSLNWDDAVSLPLTPPFLVNYPGGSTNTLSISSNGALFFEAVTNNSFAICGATYGAIANFRDGPARINPYHHDLDVTVGGGIHYEVDPANQFVRVTWANVQEWGVAAAVNTMQLTIYINGNIDVFFGSLGNQSATNNAIYGFTPGHGARLPPMIDISALLPYTSGDGAIPPVLGMDARPVLGTTPNIVTTNITPGTIVQVLAAGAVLQPIPIDLTFLGMAGCLLTTNPFVFLTNVILPNGTFAQPFAIPPTPTLQNAQLVFQAAPLTPGYNPASLLLSNGICTRLGQ